MVNLHALFSMPFSVVAQAELAGSEIISRCVAIATLIAINAFFVAAEFSIVSVRRSRINQLVQEGDAQAKTVQGLQRELDRLLSTTQLGITLSSLALGWIGEKTMATVVMVWLQRWPLSDDTSTTVAHSIAVPIAFVAIAYLQIVLGELFPKSLALIYPERLARLLGPTSLSIARLFNPFIWVLKQSTRYLLRIVGIRYTNQSWANDVTPEELQMIIATSTAVTGLEEDERELLTNVFEFGEAQVEEVMVPRTSIDAIPETASLKAVLEEVARSGHDYYPVTGESLDDIRGMLRFKNLAAALANDQISPESSIQEWTQAAWFVPEGTPIRDVLQRMQKFHLAMMMVREDESDGTAGLVTLTDLVNELLGNDDEPPPSMPGPLIQEQDNHTFLIQAQTDLDLVNEQLAIELPITDEYQTLGGFVLCQLQKIPAQGEHCFYENLKLTVATAEGPRLTLIKVEIVEPSSKASTPDEANSPTTVEQTPHEVDQS
ncbi:Magnesium and cobalt efflux protein CorC [Acaryochloris thomasi RCC1774]|uniref:Magnesium and cobalt efflux protein CorC n=1 Tax=Acaryochloris thomasi RCC1774 TaxID=1764569 RepID=A0A2W1JL65_9CYAN|nr:hemolysin family protein [Acaryochloris thomasi]PZD74133.1 Magnesium and cobalt efflux protein CorC [Acaryochloris thomasi RCC1774]